MQSCSRSGATRMLVAGALGVLSIVSSRMEAQQAQLVVSGGAGTDQLGNRSSAITIAPSLAFTPSARSLVSLGASATRFAGQSWSLGANTAFSSREVVAGPVSATLDVSANAAQLLASGGASATFGAGEVLPALEAQAGPLTFFGGLRAAAGMRAQRTATPQPSLPGFGNAPQRVQETRSGWGPTFGLSLGVAPARGPALRAGGREDRLRVGGIAIADRSLSVSIVGTRASLAAAAGRRFAVDDSGTFASAALSLTVRPDVALELGAGRYARNRLTGAPAGEYVQAGVALRFGRGGPAAAPAPVVPGAPRLAPGYTRLAIDAPRATRVEVAGDFNEWTFVPARRAASGVWYADLRIPPGQYRYAFRVNGTEWRVPRGATAVDDGYGGKSAWLTVDEPRS